MSQYRMNKHHVVAMALVCSLCLPAIGQSRRAPDDAATKDRSGIESLSRLAPVLIDHFRCVGRLVLDNKGDIQTREEIFDSPAVGGKRAQGTAQISLGDDQVQIATNAQMIEIQWTRGSQLLVSSQMMMQKLPMPSYVLIAADPTHPENQVAVNCDAVTFQDLRGTKVRGRQ